MHEIEGKLEKIRHSLAHIMAEAVLSIYPDTKIAIGPVIENGFYYDFDLAGKIGQDDLKVIEKKMKEIIKGKHDFIKKTVSKEEAKDIFHDQPYKLEILNDLSNDEEITIYTQNTFTDLCSGPHIESTKELKGCGFKLLSIAGAYWRGSEENAMLQRIYATAWDNKEKLQEHLDWLNEIEKRDHRKVGKALDLFSIQQETGTGLIYWHPKGGRLRSIIEDFWKNEHFKNGYELIYTPHIGRSWLWEKSGHLDFYNENMYSSMSVDDQDFFLKPMNCPFHIMIYKSQLHSYKKLPLRWAELGTVYRYERSGVLHGLLRVRGFTQDDAHIICRPDQIVDEIRAVLKFCFFMWKSFGFDDIILYIATRPEHSVGEDKDWETATDSLKNAIKAENHDYILDEGGGAFYGPKIDLKIKDAIGREWQVSTIQFDFNLPERFDMTYIGQDGKEQRPFMIHRALLGSLERFMGLLIEHYSGAFPIWLAPVQVEVIPVRDTVNDYAQDIYEKLLAKNIRVQFDSDSNARMNARIKKAQVEKIPYMIIIGDKEKEEGTISLRTRTGDQSTFQSLDQFIDFINGKIDTKELI